MLLGRCFCFVLFGFVFYVGRAENNNTVTTRIRVIRVNKYLFYRLHASYSLKQCKLVYRGEAERQGLTEKGKK